MGRSARLAGSRSIDAVQRQPRGFARDGYIDVFVRRLPLPGG